MSHSAIEVLVRVVVQVEVRMGLNHAYARVVGNFLVLRQQLERQIQVALSNGSQQILRHRPSRANASWMLVSLRIRGAFTKISQPRHKLKMVPE